jgi:cyclic pyranopterin phosphate synthase
LASAGRDARRSTARLTHLDARGRARMVDVGEKPETARVAIAAAAVIMKPETLALCRPGGGAGARRNPKGDVIATARLAAITALKRTDELIPLCHPVRVVGSEVDLTCDPALPGVRIRVEVHAFDRTGVEMEAMVGAAAAALTVYDMVKGVERGVSIEGVRLLEKRGGRSGTWQAPGLGKTSPARGRRRPG